MLNINDFILYMPMKGNLTDYSRNGYTATNNGATLTTGVEGIANTAYLFNGSSEYITLTSAVNQALSSAINANCTIIINFITDAGTTVQGVMSTYNNNAQNSFNMQIQNAVNQEFSVPKLDGATAYPFAAGTIDGATWYKTAVVYNVNDVELFLNDALAGSTTFSGTAKEDSTNVLWIGRRGDGLYFDGKISNIMFITKTTTKLERKYINKFGNRKRVA